jgi:hypothetical protein
VPSAYFRPIDKLSFAVYVEKRFNAEHIAKESGARINSSALLQIIKVVYREPMAYFVLLLLGK